MQCWTRYVFIIVVAALGTLSMIGACGRKGPLYLPPPQDAPAGTPSSGSAAPDLADRPDPATPAATERAGPASPQAPRP